MYDIHAFVLVHTDICSVFDSNGHQTKMMMRDTINMLVHILFAVCLIVMGLKLTGSPEMWMNTVFVLHTLFDSICAV